MGRVSAILGNGCEIKGQSYVARLQRSVLRVCYRSLCWVFDVLGESYQTRVSGLMGSKTDSHSSDLQSFHRMGDLSLLIL